MLLNGHIVLDLMSLVALLKEVLSHVHRSELLHPLLLLLLLHLLRPMVLIEQWGVWSF